MEFEFTLSLVLLLEHNPWREETLARLGFPTGKRSKEKILDKHFWTVKKQLNFLNGNGLANLILSQAILLLMKSRCFLIFFDFSNVLQYFSEMKITLGTLTH